MKTKYGYMACRDCANPRVVVKINEHETLSYTCDECGDAAYCRKGQENRATWEKRITRAPGVPAPKGDKGEDKGGDKGGAKKSAPFEL